MSDYYPISLDLKGKRCVVVGGGTIAERKIDSLLIFSASNPVVISPGLTSMLEDYVLKERISHIKRGYKKGDLEGAFLVIVATDDSEVNQAVASEAFERGILVNVVDCPRLCNFILPAFIKREHLTIAVSTGGQSPALARRIKTHLARLYEEDYGLLTTLLGELRPEVQKTISDPAQRKHLWEKAIDIWMETKDEAAVKDFIRTQIVPVDSICSGSRRR